MRTASCRAALRGARARTSVSLRWSLRAARVRRAVCDRAFREHHDARAAAHVLQDGLARGASTVNVVGARDRDVHGVKRALDQPAHEEG